MTERVREQKLDPLYAACVRVRFVINFDYFAVHQRSALHSISFVASVVLE